MSNFGDCSSDPLHTMDLIQWHGALVAFHSESGEAHYCSANTHEILGRSAAAILGKTGIEIFAEYWLTLATASTPGVIIHLPAGPFPTRLDVAVHTQGNYRVYEFEPDARTEPHWWDFSCRMDFIRELGHTRHVIQCRALLVRWMFAHSGYDRVMYYHFFPDRHGVVYDEERRPGVKSYLNLHFPASDIPPNAQAFYVQNYQRIITDVASEGVPLLHHTSVEQPLDLSRSMLRAVHPVHIEYLRNMGVAASFSISIVVKDVLQALIACHHTQPRILSLSDRLAFEEIARMASIQMDHLLELQTRDTLSYLRGQLVHIEEALASGTTDIACGLSAQLSMIRKLFVTVGALLCYNGQNYSSGETPSASSLAKLGHWLATLSQTGVYSCNSLPADLAADEELSMLACGILYLPLGDNNYLVLLRPEFVRSISWAGQPPDPASPVSLSPRHSFDQYVTESRGNAEEWNSVELELAGLLRAEILTHVERAQLLQISLHDGLTGLANRQQFDVKLTAALTECRDRGISFALHMLDLDLFKPVNDTYGHAVGDQILQEVSNRLLSMVRHSDTVARLGGDEFAIIQTGGVSEAGAAKLADKVVRQISSPYAVDGNEVIIGISVGTSLCPTDSTDGTTLLQQADTALYAAKNNGRNQFKRFVAN